MNRRQFITSILAATMLAPLPPTYGRALGKAVSQALGRKIAKRQSAREVARAAQSRRTLTQAEKQALDKVLYDLDRKTLTRIESRYGQYIDPARLGSAKACKTCFMDKQQYDDHLRKAYPGLSAKERTEIVGDYLKRPYVNQNHINVPRTLAHERLHQLSNNGKGEAFQGRFGEGITEHFAGRIYGDLAIRGAPVAYPAERRVVQMMEARVGEAPIARAYFRGDSKSLQQALDRQLGTGAFDAIVHHTERGQMALAERIIKHGL